jgi:hypothetical protein
VQALALHVIERHAVLTVQRPRNQEARRVSTRRGAVLRTRHPAVRYTQRRRAALVRLLTPSTHSKSNVTALIALAK